MLPRVEAKPDGKTPRRQVDLVFSTTGNTAVSGFSRAKTAIDGAILEGLRDRAEERSDDPGEIKAPERWILHDLRRTVATNLQKLGVQLEVTEAVLNHISGSRAGIVGIYQRHDFAAEKRAALDGWAAHVEKLITKT